jgi:hypothetical protein
MKTSSADIAHHFATAFIALFSFVLYMMMSENREQLIIKTLVFWCGSTLLKKLHARLTHALRSNFSIFAPMEADLHYYKNSKKKQTAVAAAEADLHYYKNSKKKQTARNPPQSLSPKKVALLAAIQRAKLAMQSDKQKVIAVKRKKEREDAK